MEDEKIIKFPELKIIDNDFEVQFGVEISRNNGEPMDLRKQDIINGINEVDETLSANNKRIDELNKEIDRLTNSADGIDYMVAVGSGVLAGLIDSFWVGEFSISRGQAWGKDEVDNFVVKVAKTQGYKGNDLPGAIRHLERKFGTPSDSVTSAFGGGLQHHLRDFAHHPTLVGLMFSLLTQFTEKAYGTNTIGEFKVVDIKDKTLIGKDIPHKFLFGTVFWFFHLVSDMAGSNAYAGSGTGLPGPLLSLAKELSALPFFKNKETGVNSFSVWISKLFNGTLLGKRDSDGKIIQQRFDLRSELGVAHEIGRQAVPVIINECIVRGFYFIRRLAMEIKEKDVRKISELDRVDWDRVKPIRNRTIVRMLTIATGTFTLIDLGDAAIRGGIKSGGNIALFAKEFVLHVNFVGVGRFSITIATDASMGMKRDKLRNERMAILSEQLHLMNAKIYYMQADAWVAAETTEKTINEAVEMMEQAAIISIETWKSNKQSMRNIGEYRQGIEKHNSGLIEDISDILNWG